MTLVLPLPVTPARTCWDRPERTPSTSWAMACGWSPAGLKGASTRKLVGMGTANSKAHKRSQRVRVADRPGQPRVSRSKVPGRPDDPVYGRERARAPPNEPLFEVRHT